MRLVMHLTFKDGPALARTLGCQALQIFCGNPRGWLKAPLDEDFIREFRAGVEAAKIDPVIVHATYLINSRRATMRFIKVIERRFYYTELIRSRQLGAKFYVLHIGNHMGAGPEAGRARVFAEAMRRARRKFGRSRDSG